MNMRSDDLDAVYSTADGGLKVPVVYGTFGASSVIYGWLDENEIPEFYDGVARMAREKFVTVRAGSLGTITDDTAITVDGVVYRVGDSVAVNGGLETRITLQ